MLTVVQRESIAMIGADGDLVTLLLLHNAVAVIIAVLLSRVLHLRVLTAAISLLVAICFLLGVSAVNAGSEIGLRQFIHELAFCFYDPVIYDTSWDVPEMIGVYGLVTVFISPLVFAYYASWQWASDHPAPGDRLGKHQFRLRSVLGVTTLFSILLGFLSWSQSGNITVYPIAILATCLAVRPLRWWGEMKRRRQRDIRLAQLRSRLRNTLQNGGPISEFPEMR